MEKKYVVVLNDYPLYDEDFEMDCEKEQFDLFTDYLDEKEVSFIFSWSNYFRYWNYILNVETKKVLTEEEVNLIVDKYYDEAEYMKEFNSHEYFLDSFLENFNN